MHPSVHFETRTGEAALAVMAEVSALYERVFGEPAGEFLDSAAEKPGLALWLARDANGQAVGFKLGYRRSPREFYSWLGGVDPAARGDGIARALMRAQHAWAAGAGYPTVSTQTMNRYRAMLLLNIQEGFDVVGTHTDEQGLTRIMLKKRLGPAE